MPAQRAVVVPSLCPLISLGTTPWLRSSVMNMLRSV